MQIKSKHPNIINFTGQRSRSRRCRWGESPSNSREVGACGGGIARHPKEDDANWERFGQGPRRLDLCQQSIGREGKESRWGQLHFNNRRDLSEIQSNLLKIRFIRCFSMVSFEGNLRCYSYNNVLNVHLSGLTMLESFQNAYWLSTAKPSRWFISPSHCFPFW